MTHFFAREGFTGIADAILNAITGILKTQRSMEFKWVQGSTRRIAQLTGDYDPENWPHYTYTGEWGVVGVDGAANTEFDGRTFIFFGDAAQKGGVPIPFGDPIAFIEDAPFPRGARLAIAPHLKDQLDAFFIGMDGALYVAWVNRSESWHGPFRIGPRGIAPPGGGVAAAQQTADQLDVFFIGNNGDLQVAWVTANGAWQAPASIGPTDAAEPGANLAAVQFNGRLYVFYFGKNRQLQVHSVIGVEGWQGPLVLGGGPVAPSGSWVTPILQTDKQLSVLFIGYEERLNVYWLNEREEWYGPDSLAAKQGVAPAGACLAAIKQLPDQTTVVFFGYERKPYVQWVTGNGAWSNPIAMGTQRVAEPGSAVTCTLRPPLTPTHEQPVNAPSHIRAIFVSDKGHLMEYWVDGKGGWEGPRIVIADIGAPAGSPLVAARQYNVQATVLHGGFDNDLMVSWAPDRDDWGGPNRINPYMVRLHPVLKNGSFYPFTVRDTGTLGMDCTPEGAFTYHCSAYVFVHSRTKDAQGNEASVSLLTRSCRPGEPEPFDRVFDFSSGHDPNSGRFWHVAPCLVKRTELPGFSSDSDEGVIMLGMGRTGQPLEKRPWGVHLAWLPLTPDRLPDKSQIRSYTGNGPHNWSAAESDAIPLFFTKYPWASLSVGRVPQTGHWILLYHRGGLRGPDIVTDMIERRKHPEDEPIVARVAETPWDLGAAEEIIILDPFRDGAFDARSNYMYREGQPDPSNLKINGVPIDVHPSFFYGPGLLNRYTQFNERTGIVTLYFLISTGRPYQVQLMRTAIKLSQLSIFDGLSTVTRKISLRG